MHQPLDIFCVRDHNVERHSSRVHQPLDIFCVRDHNGHLSLITSRSQPAGSHQDPPTSFNGQNLQSKHGLFWHGAHCVTGFFFVFWTPKGNSGPRWAAVSNENGPKRLICFARLNWVSSSSHGRSGAAVTSAESGGGDDGGDSGGVPLQGLRMGGAPGRGGERRLFTLPSRAFRCFLFLFLPFL